MALIMAATFAQSLKLDGIGHILVERNVFIPFPEGCFHGIFISSAPLNACFLPTFLDFAFPARTHRLSVRGDTFSSNAASFNVSHSLAWSART